MPLCNLKSLKELDLSHNLVVNIPPEFGRLQKLADLNLSGNLIVDISSDVIKQLRALERLKIGHNKLAQIPSLVSIPNLNYVSYEGNPEIRRKRTKRRFTDPDLPRAMEASKRKIKIVPMKKIKTSGSSFSHIPLSWKMDFGWADMRGRRPDQQDTFTIVPNFRDISNFHYVGLFDGHSGQKTAEFAASHFHLVLADILNTKENPAEALTLACKRIHQEIEQRELKDGTTAIILLVQGNVYFIANLGDSRAVLCTGGRAVQISVDHKPDLEDEKERIVKSGGFVAESNRVNGILALSRAIGDLELVPAISHEPDIFERPVREEDEFLILACDGLWDVVSNEEAVRIAAEQKNPIEAAVKLRDYAFSLGSNDNITVIVVSFTRQGGATIGRRASDPSSTDSEIFVDAHP
jgi:serine/threonine protein phosphatase PrpC